MKRMFNKIVGFLTFCLVLFLSCKHDEKNKIASEELAEVKTITLDGKSINAKEIEVYKNQASLIVEFAKKYENLTLFVNSEKIDVKEKIITHTIKGINEEGIEVKIEIKQKDKELKTYNFKVRLFSLKKDIVSFIFEGENINASSALNRNKKEISVEKISNDGSTNVGQTTFFKLAISLKTHSNKSYKFSVQNQTTGETLESDILNENLIKVFIPLKNGDNNLILSISKEGLNSASYKLVASYQEPEYKPITFIQFAKESYIGDEGLAKLLTGTEKMFYYGSLEFPCKIQMSETWYHDTDWNISIDGVNIEKNAFVKENASPIVYNHSNFSLLNENEEKEIKLIFENTRRAYKKEYRIKVKHESILSFNKAYFFDDKTKKGEEKEASKYKKDENLYKFDARVPFNDRSKNICSVIETEIEGLTFKYTFSKTLLTASDLGTVSWQESQKESLYYITEWGARKDIQGYVTKTEIDYGMSYFYFYLEKDGLKTFYLTPIFREKVEANNTREQEHKLLYKDSDGNILEAKNAILATEGLILVMPKNPRSTVKLLTPEEKDFTLNDEYFECNVPLNSKEVECSYSIIAENNIDKKTYNVKFTKPELIGRVRYAYKEDTKLSEFQQAITGSNSYTMEIDKNKVVGSKIYFLIEAYQGLSLECSSLTLKKSKDFAGKTLHLFEADVVSLVNNETLKQDFSINLNFNGKALGSVSLSVFLIDDVLDSIALFPDAYNTYKFLPFLRLSEDTYKLEDKLGNDNKKLIIYLHALSNEITNMETDRKIKLFDGNDEKEIRYKVRNKKVECSYTGLPINKGEEKTLKVEYYKDKNDTAPTKTYTLIIKSL